MRSNKAKESTRAKTISRLEREFSDNVHGELAPREWAFRILDDVGHVADAEEIEEAIRARGWWCEEDETED